MTELQKARVLRALSVLLAIIILLCAAVTPNNDANPSDEHRENGAASELSSTDTQTAFSGPAMPARSP